MYRGLELTDTEIQHLNPNQAVEFFRELLWAEASETDVIQSSTHVPTAITVPDGGLDAKIENAIPSREDIIPAGDSGFQIKSSDMEPKKCRQEVRSDSGSGLKSRIDELLDNGGTYIMVVFEELVGVAPQHNKDKLERRKIALEEEFEDHGYPDADVRIYDCSKLVGFVNGFPALIAKYKGIDHVVDHSTWSRSATRDVEEFFPDEKREEQIESIREILRDPNEHCPVIRVTGLPDVGKTRLVYEALAEDDLQERVIYSRAREFECSGVASRLRTDTDWSAIIIIDNCSAEDHEHFQQRFDAESDRLALITISDDSISTGADHEITVEQLEQNQVKAMLESLDLEVDEHA
ncbi:ATP-binding protein [Halobellus sp. Atlit-38R]|uniref:ATP-binding protein n=1 Tax=Halobellus sp. Atlit-38R TaxID=2282131 RepID=UPI000EF25A56|nr:ATP-binding protein [Halobellus sp. Atlit-38R]RLM83618.1 ATP-binding protein [Halobellus sp. Atlit-38R]